MATVLQVESLGKTFKSKGKELVVVDGINFEVNEGQSIAIVGPSGSGKTTLLGLCAGLDQPSEGRILLNGLALNFMDEDERSQIRSLYVGFVFQNFQLISTLTALENVMVPLELRGQKDAREQSLELLGKVGLADRHNHYPSQLSGGEQQRVALARAFSNRPKILFADEPTGNLDEETSHRVEELLFELNREAGTTLILVTHDLELAGKTQRIIQLRGGKVVSDEFTESKLLAAK